jgi:hypothetical protein
VDLQLVPVGVHQLAERVLLAGPGPGRALTAPAPGEDRWT